ncbi:lectin-like isoform X1 [Polypterus senegalus]
MKSAHAVLLLVCIEGLLASEIDILCYNGTCEVKKDVEGSGNWVGSKARYYKFVEKKKTFYTAEKFCKQQGDDANLASIHSLKENKDVFDTALKITSSVRRFWIGGLRFPKSSYFIWTDGSKWDYTNWVYGQPDNGRGNEDCVEMNWKVDQEWNDCNCEELKPFVCQIQY